MASVLSLFVPQLAFFWFLEKAVLIYCGISWISSLIFLCVCSLLSRTITMNPRYNDSILINEQIDM